MEDRFKHHDYLQDVANGDVQYLLAKDRSYGASWKLSGGRSAWFMLKRKIDRMVEMMRRPDPPTPNFTPHSWGMNDTHHIRHLADAYTAEDIFAKIAEDPSGVDGCVLAEVRDLRRYLLLVEAEMVARGTVNGGPLPKYQAARPTPDVRIENPDDPSQYVFAQRAARPMWTPDTPDGSLAMVERAVTSPPGARLPVPGATSRRVPRQHPASEGNGAGDAWDDRPGHDGLG